MVEDGRRGERREQIITGNHRSARRPNGTFLFARSNKCVVSCGPGLYIYFWFLSHEEGGGGGGGGEMEHPTQGPSTRQKDLNLHYPDLATLGRFSASFQGKSLTIETCRTI